MKKIGLLVLLLASVGFHGCKKEGCRVTSASNFDDKAKKEDGSCQFTGSTYTYISNTTKNDLLGDGIDLVNVYIDGALTGFIEISGYSSNSSSPCNSSNVGAKTLNWTGNSPYKSFNVEYRDASTDVLVDNTSVNVNAKSCNSSTLSY